MTENEIAKKILDAAFVVHTKLGPGLLESVYEVVLAHESRKKGLVVERQKPMPITYDGVRFDEAFRTDLLVNSKVMGRAKVGRVDFCTPRETSANATADEWSQVGPFDQLW